MVGGAIVVLYIVEMVVEIGIELSLLEIYKSNFCGVVKVKLGGRRLRNGWVVGDVDITKI